MATYTCAFTLNGAVQKVRVGRLSDASEGFWLNSALQFTKGSDAAIWIPPSAIQFVEKWEGTDTGKQEVRELLDFIYESEPTSEDHGKDC